MIVTNPVALERGPVDIDLTYNMSGKCTGFYCFLTTSSPDLEI